MGQYSTTAYAHHLQGHRPHPLMYWRLQLSTDQVAKALRVSSGALVQSVGPNSAAAKAGLLPTRRGLTGIVTGAAAMSLLYWHILFQSLLCQTASFSHRAFPTVPCTPAGLMVFETGCWCVGWAAILC